MRLASFIMGVVFGLMLPYFAWAGGGVSLAAAKIGPQAGAELNLNYTREFYENAFLKINYLELFAYPGESDSRYRKETISNGKKICRDTTNGQFAKKENCEPSGRIEYQPSIAAYYTLNQKFDFGLGLKLRPLWGSSPMYGAFVIRIAESRRIFLRTGVEYVSLGYEFLF